MWTNEKLGDAWSAGFDHWNERDFTVTKSQILTKHLSSFFEVFNDCPTKFNTWCEISDSKNSVAFYNEISYLNSITSWANDTFRYDYMNPSKNLFSWFSAKYVNGSSGWICIAYILTSSADEILKLYELIYSFYKYIKCFEV